MFSADDLHVFFDNTDLPAVKRIHAQSKQYLRQNDLKKLVVLIISMYNAGRVFQNRELQVEITYFPPNDMDSVISELKRQFRGRATKRKVERDFFFLANVAKNHTRLD